MPSLTLALDRSGRTLDADGRLHVEHNRISKAMVSPYYGREIPDAAKLGLDADRVYHLLRDPDELRKAAPTCNKIQLMGTHVAVSGDDPQKEKIAGTLGEKAAFDGTYLTNSIAIWDAAEVAAIESEEKREISMGYRYRPDMTPGVFGGVKYDGVMRDICFNHAALVEQGRAGPDVMVGDSKLEDALPMPSPLTSRKGLMLQGALSGTLMPLLAKDAQIDLNPVCQGVTEANFAQMTPTIRKRIEKATKGKLAQDADLAPVFLAMDAMADVKAEDDDLDAEDADPDAEDEFPPKKKGEKKDCDGEDSIPAAAAKDELPAGVTPQAMDAAIATASAKAAKAATAAATANFQAIRQAERDVQPIIGEVAAMDSARDIYLMALDHADVDIDADTRKTASVSVLRAMVKMIPDPSAAPAPRIAMDSAARKSFAERYPGAARVKQL